jgi:UDP-2,4-diacetamido-2,4,6-trideoxy-beta-L-altropyranose hydrolase
VSFLLDNSPMQIVIRTDASIDIGTGHVMRSLTLAQALRERGASCRFICREHPGNLLDLIRQRGFEAYALPMQPFSHATLSPEYALNEKVLAHAAWLGADWSTDIDQTKAGVGETAVDWMIVDHYALDSRWERALRRVCHHLMVIDDLADREHDCDLLLDQNLGRKVEDYADLVSTSCKVLVGPKYALLHPEFAARRAYSLQRRQQPVLKQVLITMGGVDQPNATGQVLQALKGCTLPQDCRISVVMGLQAPWLQQVRAQAQDMPWPTEVLVNISDMAQRMADSDLAIGAAGSTSWERCCLGLPALLVVLADNQRLGAQALQAAQAAILIGDVTDIAMKLPLAINASVSHHRLQEMRTATTAITDGRGVDKVLKAMRVLND